MIKSKQQLKQIIEQDCKASGRNPKRINPFDTIGRFLITMRRLDYYSYKKSTTAFTLYYGRHIGLNTVNFRLN